MSLLGQGSYGSVHKFHWRGRSVALKTFVNAENATHEMAAAVAAGQVARIDAAEAWVQCHPNLVCVLDRIPTMDTLVLKLAPGSELTALIPFRDAADALMLAQQLLAAVVYLHTRGMAHRDLKPDNMYWEAGRKHLTVLDLGLACAGTSELPCKGLYTTFSYAPPEMREALAKHLADPRYDMDFSLEAWQKADCFAVGLVLAEVLMPGLLSRRRQGDPNLAWVQQLTDGMYVTSICDQLPRDSSLTPWVQRLMAVDPMKRPGLRAMLEALGGAPVPLYTGSFFQFWEDAHDGLRMRKTVDEEGEGTWEDGVWAALKAERNGCEAGMLCRVGPHEYLKVVGVPLSPSIPSSDHVAVAKGLFTTLYSLHHQGFSHGGITPQVWLWSTVDQRLTLVDVTSACRTCGNEGGLSCRKQCAVPRRGYQLDELDAPHPNLVAYDVFCVGLVLYYMVVGNLRIYDLMYASKPWVPELDDGLRKVSPPLAAVMRACLAPSPSERPTALKAYLLL